MTSNNIAKVGDAFLIYSPIILPCILTSLSFVFQNFNGLVYLMFLIAVSLFRNWLASVTIGEGVAEGDVECFAGNDMEYTKYENKGFSIFVLAFSFFYVCYPMFVINDINYSIMSALLVYLIMNIIRRANCMTSTHMYSNVLGGSLLGIAIPALLHLGNGTNYLFFNEISSSKEMCNINNKKTFKCKVYKNGELVGTKTA